MLRYCKVPRYDAEYRDLGLQKNMGGIGAHDDADYETLLNFVNNPWLFRESSSTPECPTPLLPFRLLDTGASVHSVDALAASVDSATAVAPSASRAVPGNPSPAANALDALALLSQTQAPESSLALEKALVKHARESRTAVGETCWAVDFTVRLSLAILFKASRVARSALRSNLWSQRSLSPLLLALAVALFARMRRVLRRRSLAL